MPLSPRMDMEKNIKALGAMDDDPMIPGRDDVPGDMDLKAGCGMSHEDADVEEGDYANSPEEDYKPYSDVITPPTNDLNKSKKSYPKVAGGDNPMALEDELRAELSAKLSEFMNEEECDDCKEDPCECDEDRVADLETNEAKAKPDFLDMDKDGDKKEPMKKAIKDKDAKKESIEEGEGKKVQLPSGKEMKKCADKGMSKADIMKKYTEMGCEAKQLEKLYASSCGGH
jgi:hypothetical protein